MLVLRTELVTQWLDSLGRFLSIEDDRPPLLTKSGRTSRRVRPVIGRIGGGKTKPSCIVDVATFQSLTTKDDLGAPVAKSDIARYDMVICDECPPCPCSSVCTRRGSERTCDSATRWWAPARQRVNKGFAI